MLGRHSLELYSEKADGALLIASDLDSRHPVAVFRTVLAEGVDVFLADDVFVRDVFSRVETNGDEPKDNVLALVVVPPRSFRDAGGELFRGSVAVVVTWILFNRQEVLQVIKVEGAKGVLSLGIACVLDKDNFGITLKIPVNV